MSSRYSASYCLHLLVLLSGGLFYKEGPEDNSGKLVMVFGGIEFNISFSYVRDYCPASGCMYTPRGPGVIQVWPGM